MSSERANATFQLPASPASGLRCTACANRACEMLGEFPGVGKVECDTGGAAVRIEFDPTRVTEADLSVAMDRFGLHLAETAYHCAWRITGLD